MRSILNKPCFPCDGSTPILYEDNASVIMIVNSQVPTEPARHIHVQYFAIQDWKGWSSIELIHIADAINPTNNLTKPLGWVLYSRHCPQLMGHYTKFILKLSLC